MPRKWGLRPPEPVTQARSHYDPASGYTIVDVQDTEDGPAPGTAIKPLVEEYEGRNFPYRGSEIHGVDPLFDVPPSPESWEGGMVSVDVDDEAKEPEKVLPVRIVSESTKEFETWSTQQVYVGEYPVQIVGRDTRRTNLKIKNLSATVVLYVAPSEQSAKRTLAYPVDPNESFTLVGSDQLWAVSATSAQVLVAILIEFTAG